MIGFIDLPWWLGLVALLVLTAPAGVAGAAALPLWCARRGRDAVAWCVGGYVLGGALSLLAARTLMGGWGRDRTVDSDQIFFTSVGVGLVLAVLAVWGGIRRRRRSD